MNNRQEQIEQARRLIATGISEDLVAVLHQQFPELNESKDERTRKYIITRVMEENISHSLRELIIAYLERHKEPLTPEEKMNRPLYLEGFDVGKKVGEVATKPAEWSEEQSDFPTTDEQIKEFLATHPEIKVPEKYENPDWLFKKQDQPEVELEKFTEKIKTFQGRYKHPEIVSIKGAMAFMARMFYQYPNVARQWYDNLPKTTMD